MEAQGRHSLHLEDLLNVANERPESIIIGTWFNGALKVSQDLVRELVSRGIEVYSRKPGRQSLFSKNSPFRRGPSSAFI